MDDDEIKEISQTMATLGTVNSAIVEKLFVEFADHISATGSLVVTTGGQVIEAIKNITEAGAKVVKVIVALDRLEGGKDNILAAAPGVPYEAILTKAEMGMS